MNVIKDVIYQIDFRVLADANMPVRVEVVDTNDNNLGFDDNIIVLANSQKRYSVYFKAWNTASCKLKFYLGTINTVYLDLVFLQTANISEKDGSECYFNSDKTTSINETVPTGTWKYLDGTLAGVGGDMITIGPWSSVIVVNTDNF